MELCSSNVPINGGSFKHSATLPSEFSTPGVPTVVGAKARRGRGSELGGSFTPDQAQNNWLSDWRGQDAIQSYSYLSDSTGSTLAALRAGKNPAQKPMSVRIPVVSAIMPVERTG